MKVRIIIGTAVLACFLLLVSSALAQHSSDPFAQVPKLLQILDRDGFTVQQGGLTYLNPIQRVCINGDLPSTFYNNLGAPYLAVMLPPAAEDSHPLKTSLFYHVREDEAILVVGRTPPPVAYYSYQTFLFGRYNQNTTSFLGNYDIMWSYVADPVNSLNIQTTGPDPYNRPMAVISTGHRKTQERVRAALLAAGYPAASINTETLSPSLLRLGYGENEKGDNLDAFVSLIRMAIPRSGSEQALQDFIAQPPLTAFRIRPKVAFTPDPLPAPVLRTRGTGHTEMDLYPTLQNLRDAIIATYGKGNELDTNLAFNIDAWLADQLNLGWVPGNHDGSDLHEGSESCCRDQAYHATPWFDLPENGFAMVYGVNHAAAGKATYSNVTVYLDPIYTLGVSTVQSPKMVGTARSYLPKLTDKQADQFFVLKVKRDCQGEANCIDAKLDQSCPPLEALEKNNAYPKVRIMFRAYAEPATTVGPNDPELLFERVIVYPPQ